MFRKILIANRGEIAVRIIRACKQLGIKTVAVYSEADKESLHTKLADEKICIGEAQSSNSYLDMEAIITAAIGTNVDAIHPGFGFLSENERFAEKCHICNIKFIGPSTEVIKKMGDKIAARTQMEREGIAVIPGTNEPVLRIEDAEKKAKEIGFPVILKAASGGGGKGMRVVNSIKELHDSFEIAQLEAENSFRDKRMYLEKYMEQSYHIEFQILADQYGNVLHLGERDCSIQRHHQKLIEEAPSINLNEKLRKQMGEVAVKVAKAVKYEGAGTVEFLLDENGNFYFMEMNTRIQVEHGITEMLTGVDIVKEQIRIAAGEELNINQSDLRIAGHAIECRINAEDPENNFIPCPGQISKLHFPGGNGVRIDSSIYPNYVIPPYYDSMLAKIMVYDKDRKSAIEKMKNVLSELVILGVKTNLDFQYKIINNPVFENGNVKTDFVEKIIEV